MAIVNNTFECCTVIPYVFQGVRVQPINLAKVIKLMTDEHSVSIRVFIVVVVFIHIVYFS